VSGNFEQHNKDLIESGATGHDLIEGIKALDAERAEAAAPIYPDPGEASLDVAEARDLAQRFRSLRDQHRGELVMPRSALPAEPGRVAAALMAESEAREQGMPAAELRATRRELAATMVDLQSFRPDAEASAILADPGTPAGTEATDRLLTARAALIAWIRDDLNVMGNRNALRDLDVRIGDGRRALDAVNSYRETQAFGMIAMVAVVALVVIGIVIFVVIQVVT
jgi:hypothetical protein